ncbi:MAG: hypothetical protein N2589_01340 [bacterium]|nr:hypothetical protein [bacterium]MCX7916761.1 hypothetical protein [bacterium]MDW8164406.1 hypothetical protein [Candidatus Omnitrophota bacterium]
MKRLIKLIVFVLVFVSLSWAVEEQFPEGGIGFAGMLSGKIISKGQDQIVIQVTKVEKVWKHNRAQNPSEIIGKQIILRINPEIYKKKPSYLDKVRKFFSILKIGDTESFDCKHTEGNVFTMLELTELQLKRIGEVQ